MSLIAGNLGAVQQLLDEAHLTWGVCSGAAAYVYGSRRPIANVDILLPLGRLRQVRDLLQQNRRLAQYDGHILLWRGIKLFDDLPVPIEGQRHPFHLDQAMEDHLRRLPLLGSRVLILAPEDVLAQKVLLSLQEDDGLPNRPHRQDFLAVARTQHSNLDLEYLRTRLRICSVEDKAGDLLAEAGLSQ